MRQEGVEVTEKTVARFMKEMALRSRTVASVMDLYSRKIVGFQMSERMTKELVINALDQAY